MEQLLNLILVGDMRAIGNGIGIPFRRNTGQGVIWPPDLKSALVCWYSPRKQKLTEYDVIESYVEDFTGWEYRDYRGTAKITNNAIIITNVVETNNIVEDAKEPYSDLTIRVTGVTEDKYLIVRQGRGRPETHIKKDGIYIFPNNNLYFGFAVNKTGDCNITITQLPTSILKDLSGNGNHAYLYGGKGKLNSGMGLYKVDFTSWRKSSVQTEVKPDVVKVTPNTSNYLFIQYANSVEIPSYKIKVIGLGDNVLKYQYATENGRKEINIVEGENELPTSIKVSNDYQIGYRLTPGTSVFTITQIPDYPNQLCYDGKMYAVCYGFPILTDYTVMADRTWFEIGSNSCFASKRLVRDGFDDIAGAFAIEYRQKYCNNFGAATAISFEANKQEVIVQTKAKYMSTNINVGDGDDSDILIIGANNNRTDAPREPYKGCHSDFLLFNRTLTQEEIDLVKNKIFSRYKQLKYKR